MRKLWTRGHNVMAPKLYRWCVLALVVSAILQAIYWDPPDPFGHVDAPGWFYMVFLGFQTVGSLTILCVLLFMDDGIEADSLERVGTILVGTTSLLYFAVSAAHETPPRRSGIWLIGAVGLYAAWRTWEITRDIRRARLESGDGR